MNEKKKYLIDLTEKQAIALDELGYKIKCADMVMQTNEEEQEKEWPYMKCQFWYINIKGKVDWFLWNDLEEDYEMLKIGNCFKTQEEAEFEVERLKVIHELKQFAKSDDNWEYSAPHFYIFANSDEYFKVDIDYVESWKSNNLYFTSKEDAQKAIDIVGEERIKKYYLRVEQ